MTLIRSQEHLETVQIGRYAALEGLVMGRGMIEDCLVFLSLPASMLLGRVLNMLGKVADKLSSWFSAEAVG